MSEQIGPIYDPPAYAGFVRRTTALILDLAILAAAYYAMAYAWYWCAPAAWITAKSYLWIWLIWVIGACAYQVGFRMTERGTPGYRLVGIRYAYMLSGEPSRLWRAFRAVTAIFLLCFFFLDHIWILFDDHKQAWHDKVTGFYVVRKDAQPTGTRRVVQRVVNFMMLSFVVWEPEERNEPSRAPGAISTV